MSGRGTFYDNIGSMNARNQFLSMSSRAAFPRNQWAIASYELKAINSPANEHQFFVSNRSPKYLLPTLRVICIKDEVPALTNQETSFFPNVELRLISPPTTAISPNPNQFLVSLYVSNHCH